VPSGVCNALTVDVEDYFQVTAFERVIDPATWDRYPLRVGDNTRRILDLFDGYGVKGTFFVLGWVAQREPELVREIQRRGHEIACHGFDHQLIYRIGPEAFRQDIRHAKALLEDITGKAVYGYRAPSYSITASSLWALDLLIQEGFTYDSSIFPIMHDIYGIPDAPRFPHTITRPAGIIREFPISTIQVRGFYRNLRLPVGGGGYLRLLPAYWFRRAFQKMNALGLPAVLYFHPWEIDPGQPRIKAGYRSRFRHYLNLGRMEGRLSSLLATLPFAPMGKVLSELTESQAGVSGER
jgi:polysaccharide deacetylase family protein (PEP-CTERM system associated)